MAHGVSIIQARIELTRRMRAYAIRVATLHAQVRNPRRVKHGQGMHD